MSERPTQPRSEAEIFAITPEDRDHLEGRDVIVSTSGGKDSAAVLLLLERAQIPFRAVMMDTQWEHPWTLEYVRNVLAPRFGGVEIIESEGMPALVNRKGVFPSRKFRFCTEYLKFEPFKAWVDKQRSTRGAQACAINVLGIRRAESKRRSTADRWSRNAVLGMNVWRPLIDHSFDDIIEMHRVGGLEPNPLYLAGASRVGCFPCIHARKAEVAMLPRLLPERVEQIRGLEQRLTRRVVDGLDDADREAIRIKSALRVAYQIAGGRHARQMPPWGDWRRHFEGERREPASTYQMDFWAHGESWRGYISAKMAMLQSTLLAAIDAGEYADELAAEVRRSMSRTYFHGSATGSEPIDAVIEWAANPNQVRLLEPSETDGCARWGLCEGAGQ